MCDCGEPPGGENRRERLEYIRRIVDRRDRAGLSCLREEIADETDPWVLATMVKAIGVLGSSRDIPLLQDYLRHPDARVQANAVEALAMIGDEVVFPLLLPLLHRRDNRVKANALTALMGYDRQQAIGVLVNMVRSGDSRQVESALYCFSVIDGPEVAPLILELFERLDEGPACERAASILIDKGDVSILHDLEALCARLSGARFELAVKVLAILKEKMKTSSVILDDGERREGRGGCRPAPDAGASGTISSTGEVRVPGNGGRVAERSAGGAGNSNISRCEMGCKTASSHASMTGPGAADARTHGRCSMSKEEVASRVARLMADADEAGSERMSSILLLAALSLIVMVGVYSVSVQGGRSVAAAVPAAAQHGGGGAMPVDQVRSAIGKVVSGAGLLKSVKSFRGRTVVVVQAGGRYFAVVPEKGLATGLKAGSRVGFRGRVEKVGRFGALYLVGVIEPKGDE